MQTGPAMGRVKQFQRRELRSLPMYQPLPRGLPLNDKHYLHDPHAKQRHRTVTQDHGLTPQPPGVGAAGPNGVSNGYDSDGAALWCEPWGEGWMIQRLDRVFSASINGDGTILAVGGRDNLVAIYKLTWPKVSEWLGGGGILCQAPSTSYHFLLLPDAPFVLLLVCGRSTHTQQYFRLLPLSSAVSQCLQPV